MGDSDEESYVVYGEPFSDEEDDAKRFNQLFGTKRTNRPQAYEQAVLNEKGRPLRFHGAFTGGFSAGYFNTVGSKEGFVPKSFVSSRKNRDRQPDDSNIQRPEDFMDDEDFGEFGIAPRRIKTTYEFDDSHLCDTLQLALGDQSVIPGAANVLKKLIVLHKGPLAERLLRRFGWKTYSTKSLDDKDDTTNYTNFDDSHNNELPAAGMFAQIHFHPKTNTFGLGYSGLDPNLALGRGSSGVASAQRHPEESLSALLHKQQSINRNAEFDPKTGFKRRGITGQAFGVGVLQTEDEDVYTHDSLNNYDWAIGTDDEDEEEAEIEAARIGRLSSTKSDKLKSQSKSRTIDGWTAPTIRTSSKTNSNFIPGFCQGSNPLNESPFVSCAINLPSGYVPVFTASCIFSNDDSAKEAVVSSSDRKSYQTPLDSISRTRLLNDSNSDSIMESLDPVHQLRLKAASLGLPVPNLTEKRVEQCSTNITAGLLKPFQSDSNKQARFEAYQVLIRRGFTHEDAYERCSTHLNLDATEHETEAKLFASFVNKKSEHDLSSSMATETTTTTILSEKTNTTNAGDFVTTTNHRNMIGAIPLHKQTIIANKLASRFRSAGCMDISKELSESEEKAMRARVESLETVEPRDHAVATESYGALTRRRLKWHPDKILCKRLNIPDPFPDSTFVGCPDERRPRNPFRTRFNRHSKQNEERDKEFSIFDLLDVNMGSDASNSNVMNKNPTESSLFSVLFKNEQSNLSDNEDTSESDDEVSAIGQDINKTNDVDNGGGNVKAMLMETVNDSVNTTVSSDTPRILGPKRPDENELSSANNNQPSMDLFKSIFASDEEIESDSDDVDSRTGGTDELTDSMTLTNNTTIKQNSVETDLLHQFTEPRLLAPAKPSALFAHLFKDDVDNGARSLSTSDRNVMNATAATRHLPMSTTISDTSSYGPDLPPNYDGNSSNHQIGRSIPDQQNDSGVIEDDDSVEFVEASKYPNKQHKGKKKHKKKHS